MGAPSSPALEAVVGRLERVKRRGAGYIARCPAHEDREPSLSVGIGDDGRVLVHCHAGCTTPAVLDALGLTEADLFDRANGPAPLVELESYRYVDERGRHLYDVVRFVPKTFRQRRAGGEWGLGSTRRVLYRLPELRAGIDAGRTVYVVEGERDVHRLELEGEVATTCPMGAGKWNADYTVQLRGAELVRVVADHDAPGIAHARHVAAELELAGLAVELLVAPTAGYDVSDWLDDMGELDELEPLGPELEAELDDGTFRPRPVDWIELEANGVPELEWLDEPFLPKRKRVLAVGPAESGKSLWAAAKAAELSRAGVDVVYVTQENGLEEEARRFLRLGVDVEHLRLYVDQEFDLTLDDHRVALLETCAGAELVVLDALSAVWFGDEDSNAEIGAFDRDVLKPLTVAGAAVLVLDHTGNPAPGRSKGKRTGVAAPRGASSKGQKADFLLEFTPAGDGAFHVERGKKRGTHGRTPYVYRVLDRDDGSLELAGAPESTAEETLEDVFADGKWRTAPEVAKDAKIRRVDVEAELERSPEFAVLPDAKRVGRSPNAHLWGTLNMHAALAFTHPLARVVPPVGRENKTGPASAAEVSSPVPKGTGVRETTRRGAGSQRARRKFTCSKCGVEHDAGTGNRGDVCRDCLRPDLA